MEIDNESDPQKLAIDKQIWNTLQKYFDQECSYWKIDKKLTKKRKRNVNNIILTIGKKKML